MSDLPLPLRTIIAGSRTARREDVRDAMRACPFAPEITEVLSGTARGADTFGEMWAAAKGRPIRRFPADWNLHGKRAGYVRNAQMAENAEALVAVWDGTSRGTGHMIDLARQRNLRVFVFLFTPHPPGAT